MYMYLQLCEKIIFACIKIKKHALSNVSFGFWVLGLRFARHFEK
jgi:hypothetical protein